MGNAKQWHAKGSPSRAGMFYENVYTAMVHSGDWCSPSAPIYAQLLIDYKVPVSIYSGNLDPLLGPPTTEPGVDAIFDIAKTLDASISNIWEAAEPMLWYTNFSDHKPAGRARCTDAAPRFCYIIVEDAGHSVPGFQPRFAYDMIHRLLHNQSFDDESQLTMPQRGGQDAPNCGGYPPFAMCD